MAPHWPWARKARITGIAAGMFALVTAAGVVAASPPADAAGSPPRPARLTEVSSDPFTNPSSYHATQVEPDTYAAGSTIVGAFQSGRFFDGGASDIGWVTSLDAGRHWHRGFLPDTVYSGGPYARISDPVAAYDLRHHTWLISGLTVNDLAVGTDVTVNRSSDGLHWSRPVTVFHVPSGGFVDKDWTTCDNSRSSPHFGNCYAEFDLPSQNELLQMSVSTDGGRTWSSPKPTADMAHGLGGQPLVQPGGRVVVPYEGFDPVSGAQYIGSFVSANGGATWSAHHVVSPISMALDGGAIRNSPLPSAQEDAAGRVYVVWNDCRFRPGCPSNDIVLSTSASGTTWTPTVRVPIGSVAGNADHMIPGIDIQPGTSGPAAKVALYYYYYPNNICDLETCRLDVGYISSVNGGRTWSAPARVAGPMLLGRIAPTSGGLMVGDYIGTAIVSGRAFALFATGLPAAGHKGFNEPMELAAHGEPVTGGPNAVQSAVSRAPAAGHVTSPTPAGPLTRF
ncbi:MAG: exo-alpha-sialidase [Streptosporangiaceae bacterium]|nr:exo-alpha-sialidase [Kutzneria sp.]MBV9855639.1 exo-alpha-sialidase [Streptosporangiaceae bacterium]